MTDSRREVVHARMSLAITIAVAILSYVVIVAYRSRQVIGSLRKQQKPMPKFDWLFGHLLFIKSCVSQVPADAVFNYTALSISRTFTKQHMFYLDLWPFTIPALVVANPYAADQIMRHSWIDKPKNVFDAFLQMSGGPNLITMPEMPWKRWRSIFSPGFSSGYMLEQVPKLVEQGEIFRQKLRGYAASGEIFQFEEATFRLAVDVIGIIGLDFNFKYQSTTTKFPDTMRSLIEVVTFGTEMNPFKRVSPLKYFNIWRWGRYLDAFIHERLDKRFAERKLSQDSSKVLDGKGRKMKSIVALALDTYMTEENKRETAVMDPDFKRYATAQLRVFLVAGHDTTSSAITYSLHLLHTHREFLSRVRKEHDAVFGTNLSTTTLLLKDDPNLLNRLPLTLAAIKEALRLFPPAGGIRMGSPDITLTAEDGTQFPTADCQVWIVHEALHRNPAYWPEPDSYIPERWLVGPEHPLYPIKGAWRAFESGPHACIGQTLAMIEIKTILVLVLREFDIEPAYEEWDLLQPRKGIKTARGERAYQVAGGGGGQHPADRYPCRIKLCNR